MCTTVSVSYMQNGGGLEFSNTAKLNAVGRNLSGAGVLRTIRSIKPDHSDVVKNRVTASKIFKSLLNIPYEQQHTHLTFWTGVPQCQRSVGVVR